MDTRDEVIAGLRELADWLEATPAALVTEYNNLVSFYGAEKADLLALARVGGGVSKDYVGSYFELSKDFSGGVRYEMNALRDEICTARVIGQRPVMRSDPAAPKVEVLEDVVEWDCHPLLAP